MSTLISCHRLARRRMRTGIVFICLLVGFALAEELSFQPVKREVVEERMKQVTFGNEKRSKRLQALFKESQCEGERFSTQHVPGFNLGNIICVLPGASDSVIIVGAHFDHAHLGHGAVDNWSGAALLPSLYQSIATEKRKHTYVFIGFTEEEKGLIGSEYYAYTLRREQRGKIRAMINLDSLGLGTPVIWLTQGDAQLAGLLKTVADGLKIPLMGVNMDGVGSTDSVSFSKRNIPSLTIHSIRQETLSVLHSPNDTLAAIKLDDYYETYRLIAAYLVYLDSKLAE
jgi:Zn-dependent M28 family amino/carboxypeptidase